MGTGNLPSGDGGFLVPFPRASFHRAAGVR
jgi:hypothetical protein